eukprot:TRINITY_DN14622_c0_g1_i1.p1 TRINITY_DN14622_c0_g1~~TRINITY_DN14622_c0_g1_i1.p1  ORF type:complete len:195 (+),score=23.76 TRINITY_DN14622_c0_g1_i1:64-648(+)
MCIRDRLKMESKERYDYSIKVVLSGTTRVGKSSIYYYFTDEKLPMNVLPTIGVDFIYKTIDIGTKTMRIQIWDLAGHHRFRAITASYYRQAHAVVFVFDITNRNSFEQIEVDFVKLDNSDRHAERILIGNKCELAEERQVSIEEADAYAESKGMKYIETSVRDGTNILFVFESLATRVKEKIDSGLLLSLPKSL